MHDKTHENDPRFVEYYAEESATEKAAERAAAIMNALMKVRARLGDRVDNLLVADIGCNAGTQSRCWLNQGHTVRGVDISQDLVELARTRTAEYADKAEFQVGSATELPWESSQFDVCLLPELLEHVEDWKKCVEEAVRVLKPGGTLFLSTTNVLCPKQQEFTLPLYSWYPAPIKRHFVRKSMTTAPQLVNFATYPAFHWFSPYGLKRTLAELGVDAMDRFDIIDVTDRGVGVKAAIGAIRALPPLRFVGHVLTPATIIVGRKKDAPTTP